MKAFKIVLFCGLFVSIQSNVLSQTKLIAYKSHSGKLRTFSKKEEGNFGIVPGHRLESLDSIAKISDTLLVAFSHRDDKTVVKDTVRIDNYNYLGAYKDMPINEVKKRFPTIRFIGFDKPNKEKKPADRKH